MWPPLPHRRWLWLNAGLVTALLNAAITGAIAVLTVPGHGVAAWSWSTTSTIVDGWVTLFTLPLITTVVVTFAVRRSRRAGRLERLSGLAARLPWLALLPAPLVLRGALAGACLVAALGLPLAGALALAGHMGHDTFVAYKAGLAVLLGLLVTPPLALRAMAER